MKKTLTTTFIFILFPLCFFIIGCCKENLVISGVYKFFIYDTEKREEIEIIRRKPFDVKLDPKLEIISQNLFEYSNGLYATTCQTLMKNCIKAGSVKLLFSKEIRLLGKTVSQNTNLINELNLEYTAINTECKELAVNNGYVTVKFSKDLMNNIQIENGFATFKISYETNDGRLVQAEKEIYITL